MLYNVVLVSAIQQFKSAIILYIYILSLLSDSFELIVLYLFLKEGPAHGVTGHTIPEIFLLPGNYFA